MKPAGAKRKPNRVKPRAKPGSTFDQGVERLVAAVLASPEFSIARSVAPKERNPIRSSRLPIWNSHHACPSSFGVPAPDDELLNLAESRWSEQAWRDGRAGPADARGSAGFDPGQQLRDEMAESGQSGFVKPDPEIVPPDSTTSCAGISSPKRTRSSAAFSWRIAASWIC